MGVDEASAGVHLLHARRPNAGAIGWIGGVHKQAAVFALVDGQVLGVQDVVNLSGGQQKTLEVFRVHQTRRCRYRGAGRSVAGRGR